MAKKFGEFLFATAVICAAAGAYMYFQKKKNEKDDFDDFDDFEDDDAEDTDTDETSDQTAEAKDSRSYVSLDLEGSKNATEEFFDDEEADTATQTAPEA